MHENLFVYGDTGCGKTTHLEQVCAVLNRGIVRVNPHDGITREMFLGGMKLINNETIFVEGALPIAMRNGYVFLVDEISFLPPNLTAILNPIGEKGGKLYIPETSEWITPSPGFCIFATDNTGGKGDRTGNYTGTEVQNTATLDRFAFCLKMNYLPEDKEGEMLTKRFPNQETSEILKMLDFACEIRSAFSRGELSITLSTRKLIKFFDQRSNNFTIEEALSNTILSWLDEDDETLVKTMIDRLDILNSPQSQSTHPLSAHDRFLKHLKNNELDPAIKIYRAVYNHSLIQAKQDVEAMRDGTKPIPKINDHPSWKMEYKS
jgi:cobaltochelatase CobS